MALIHRANPDTLNFRLMHLTPARITHNNAFVLIRAVTVCRAQVDSGNDGVG